MSFFQKYAFIALLSARSNLVYLAEIYSRLFFMAVILYIFLKLWQATYTVCGAEKLGDLTLQQMLWYVTITEAIMLSGPRITSEIDEDVRTGAICVKLIRPLSYPLAKLSSYLGDRSVRFALNFTAGCLIATILAGAPQFSFNGLLALAVCLPLAFAVDFLGCFLIGLGAFWLEDTAGIFLIYSRLCMIGGGMLMPLDLLPDWLRNALLLTPFPTVVYGPAHVFLKPDIAEVGLLILRQSCAVVALSILTGLIWNRAMRRVFSNGG